ncbi:MAG: rRNA pseudouridine synthase [Clostridiales bacterium]|nr:rRNA pseudouridine synthase [Clostridiales bacterium]
MLQRLDKVLSGSGLVTRSQARDALRAGRVLVNGIPARDGAAKVDPEADCVTLDGQKLTGGHVVLLLNKPAGFVTSTQDPRDRTVIELLPPELRRRVTPVGRLDKETEGLLLFTDDGDLTHRLISPKNQVPKVYYARHQGPGSQADMDAFAQGLILGDGTKCLPATLEPLGPGESLITVCEGKYHQVRRMMAARGMPVSYLERRQEGKLCLGELPRGAFRQLSPEEIRNLCADF